MIDIQKERVVLLSDAPKAVPGRPHISTLQRWRLRGIHGVKLETILCGGKRYTSHEALQRFFERTTAAADQSISQTGTSAIEAAQAHLESEGI